MTSSCTPVCSVPSVAPGGLRVSRSPDGLSMNISWSPLTLSQARGFVDYVISYRPVDGDKQLEIMTNVTYVTATSLNAMATYSIMVRVQTSKGLGPSALVTSSPLSGRCISLNSEPSMYTGVYNVCSLLGCDTLHHRTHQFSSIKLTYSSV